MYKIANKYTKKFENMKKESVGLLLYGSPGNGKTYTVACIANFLIEKMLPVICVNADSLLNRIKDTYKKWGKEVEEDVLRGLDNADLLIIDDLGTEQDTEWTRTKIYNILDSRYRNGLPLIITTNLSLMELKNRYEKRTYYRILEMCTPILNDGKNIREEKAKEKTEILKEYVKKSIDYEELLKESMNLLDKYQEKLEILGVGKNRWTDEVVNHYFTIKDLQKALDIMRKEIIIYELNKNNKEV